LAAFLAFLIAFFYFGVSFLDDLLPFFYDEDFFPDFPDFLEVEDLPLF